MSGIIFSLMGTDLYKIVKINFMNESELSISPVVVVLPFFVVPLLTFEILLVSIYIYPPFHTRYSFFSIYLIVPRGGDVISYFSLSAPSNFPYSILLSPPSRAPPTLLLFLSSSATLYFLEQHYLIIDRMILPSTRMAWPAEHTFEFVNVRP